MKTLLRLFCWVTFGYALFSLYRIVTTTALDFTVYYDAARLFIERKQLSGNTGLYTGFGYPPSTLLIFIPFLLLPYSLAQGLWVTLSLLLIPVCVWISLKLINPTQKVALSRVFIWSCVWFWSFPTKWTLGMGQINLVSLVFLLSGMYVSVQKHFFYGSILLCIAMLAKPQFLLLFPYLFLTEYWRVAFGTFITYSIVSFFTGIVFGFEYYQSYVFNEVVPLMVFKGRDIYYNQSFAGFFSRILAIPIAEQITKITTVVVLGGLGIRKILDRLQKRKQTLVQLALLFLPIVVLVEPLAWQHHFVFILPVYIWLWYKPLLKSERSCLILSYVLVALNIKQPNIFMDFLSHMFILSHVFWGTALLFLISARSYNKNKS